MKYGSERFSHIWQDILQIWFSGYLKIVSKERREQISPVLKKHKYKLILKESLKDFIKVFVKNKIPKNKIWCFSISLNNHEVLGLIKNSFVESIFVVPYNFKQKFKGSYTLNYNRKFLYDILFPFNFFQFYFRVKSKEVEFYDLLFKTNGVYSESLRVLRKFKPKAIIFANDHEIIPRGLLLAANKLNIPTIYIQHASVSKYFPALDFKYALLEGQDAKDKYLNKGECYSEIHLVGMPKFDKYLDFVNTSDAVKTIGIAYNAMDDINLVVEIVSQLKKAFPKIQFIVRPHPSDNREINIKGVSTSLPQKEQAFNFLSNIDALIAAESSIHLEAIMLNVYSMSFSFSNSKFLDYYGFVKNNLIKHYYNFEELILEIKRISEHKPKVQERARYYNAALNSDFYGKSVQKIHEIIKNKI